MARAGRILSGKQDRPHPCEVPRCGDYGAVGRPHDPHGNGALAAAHAADPWCPRSLTQPAGCGGDLGAVGGFSAPFQ